MGGFRLLWGIAEVLEGVDELGFWKDFVRIWEGNWWRARGVWGLEGEEVDGGALFWISLKSSRGLQLLAAGC